MITIYEVMEATGLQQEHAGYLMRNFNELEILDLTLEEAMAVARLSAEINPAKDFIGYIRRETEFAKLAGIPESIHFSEDSLNRMRESVEAHERKSEPTEKQAQEKQVTHCRSHQGYHHDCHSCRALYEPKVEQEVVHEQVIFHDLPVERDRRRWH